MTELSGTLDGIGLAPLVSFLTGLGKSGRLSITDGPMGGEVFLEGGQVVGATFDQERGLAALDAIGLALGNGRFGFYEQDNRPIERNLTLNPTELRQHLDELGRESALLAASIPSLSAIPTVAVEETNGEDQIGLDRDTLRLLMQIDGRRSVADLARERGLLRTLKQLARLAQLNLARIEPANGPAAASPPSAQAPTEWTRERAAESEPSEGHQAAGPERPGAEPPAPSPRPGGSTWQRWRGGGSSSS